MNLFKKIFNKPSPTEETRDLIVGDGYIIFDDVSVGKLNYELKDWSYTSARIIRRLCEEGIIDLVDDYDRLYTATNLDEVVSKYRILRDQHKSIVDKVSEVIKYKVLSGENIEDDEKVYVDNLVKYRYYNCIVEFTNSFIDENGLILYYTTNTRSLFFPNTVKDRDNIDEITRRVLKNYYSKYKIYVMNLNDDFVYFYDKLLKANDNIVPKNVEFLFRWGKTFNK